MLNKTIIDLWHISKTALINQECKRYDRMIYIKNELIKSYPNLINGLTNKQIWLEIENELK
jgi:hypothetical protein